MISVIIPVYNTEKYLHRCISSVLRSIYRDFEILLINDGSEDGSAAICKEYVKRDSRVRYYEQENRGVSAARNKGIEECKGDWIVFVDSDDCITCDFFSTIVKEEYQLYDLLLFDYIVLNKKMRESERETLVFENAGICCYGKEEKILLIEKIIGGKELAENSRTSMRAPWAKAFKRSIIDENHICFPVEISIGEDALFNIEYIQKMTSCLHIQKQVYFYEIHPDSVSHGLCIDFMFNDIVYQKQMRELLEQYCMFQQLEKAYYNSVLFSVADILIKDIFNPYTTRTFREECRLCCRIHENDLYTEALQLNSQMGRFSRRVLLFFFKIKCYPIVKLLCEICCKILEKMEQA